MSAVQPSLQELHLHWDFPEKKLLKAPYYRIPMIFFCMRVLRGRLPLPSAAAQGTPEPDSMDATNYINKVLWTNMFSVQMKNLDVNTFLDNSKHTNKEVCQHKFKVHNGPRSFYCS